jgi:hypothetical protein
MLGDSIVNAVSWRASNAWVHLRNACTHLDYWAQRMVYDAKARVMLRHSGVDKPLAHFMKDRPSDAIPPDYCDLWLLFNLVRRKRPRIVFEFGAGCSTVVLAEALQQNGSGFLHSIDSEEIWTKIAWNSLPMNLRNICEVQYSTVSVVERYGVKGFKHDNVPDEMPEFVYLDGPPLTSEVNVVVDILDIEHRLPDDFCMVLDGRYDCKRFLLEHLKRDYHFNDRVAFKNSIWELNPRGQGSNPKTNLENRALELASTTKGFATSGVDC